MPLYGGGDILSFEDYNRALETRVSGTMIARCVVSAGVDSTGHPSANRYKFITLV